MKATYRKMNEKIQPDPELNGAVMERIAPRRRVNFRPLTAVAAMLAVILLATPVMAECIPWILERIAPELVEEFVPVQRSNTNNAITMEVVAASIDGDVAELVVKLQGEVLVDPVGVAPFLEISTTGHTKTTIYSIRDYEGAEIDWANGIYYYQVEMTYRDGTPIEEILGNEMTVVLEEILISGFSSEDVEVPVIFTDYAQITVVPERAMKDYGFSSFGWGDSEGYEYYGDLDKYVLMTPGESVYDVTDKLSLTGAAYIDGKLHIQMAAVDVNGGEPEWGYRSPCFLDSEGNQITNIYRNYFAINEGGHRIDYVECIYDIPQEELENYTMVVKLEYYDMIPCNCQVTFQFEEMEYAAE